MIVNPPIVPILQSGVLAQEFCRQHACAEVAAVFDRSLYLRSGDIFLCVGEAAISPGPLTLISDPALRLSDLGFYREQPAVISHHHIAIGQSVRFTLDRCALWRPPGWPMALPTCDLADVCKTLLQLIAAEAPAEGFGRLISANGGAMVETPLARIAHPRILRFESWLRSVADTDRVAPSEPIQALIGLGPGLTPSGDDFLIGALALLDALGQRNARAALARAIAAAPDGLTSPLSNGLLQAAAARHVGEAVYRAVSAAITGAAVTAVAAIRRIGHSSGWDMLAGLATALQVVAADDRSRSATEPCAVSIGRAS